MVSVPETVTAREFDAQVPSSSVAVALMVQVTPPEVYVCDTLEGLPVIVCTAPSPQLMTQRMLIFRIACIQENFTCDGIDGIS